ncbi:hypothetical protein ACUHMQ_11915 [Chitinimonas sp. PSY-7]|uniref:hypothetical protein n=1 Tax=Chitinimonas sp. PSY-7 TaxID=3459088 RepID=UPI00404021CA
MLELILGVALLLVVAMWAFYFHASRRERLIFVRRDKPDIMMNRATIQTLARLRAHDKSVLG